MSWAGASHTLAMASGSHCRWRTKAGIEYMNASTTGPTPDEPERCGRTAEAFVKEGKATAVRDYLDHMALGGFA